jgi:SnoaL-like protein
MREIETLLFANETFYRAVSDRDIETLEALWSMAVSTSCLHPGWPPLNDRDEVMDSWRRIITGPSPPIIECISARAHLIGNIGLVTCYEQIGGEWLVATNLFVREGADWAIFHHQSGPAGAPPDLDEEDNSSAIN